jgi:uncharacterized membrane protein YedE/YeeE
MIPIVMAIATLVVGLLIGYMGQRSTFCTISGIRDLILRHNTYRFRGLIGLIVGGVFSFVIFRYLLGNITVFGSTVASNIPDFPLGMDIASWGVFIATVIGGLGLGYWSVMAEGCPFRQHVMAGEGKIGSMYYLLGFYVGIAYFFLVTVKWLNLLLIVLH